MRRYQAFSQGAKDVAPLGVASRQDRRVRNAGGFLLPWPAAVTGSHHRVRSKRARSHMPRKRHLVPCEKPHGAAGAVNRPVVPHAPCRGKPEDNEQKTGVP